MLRALDNTLGAKNASLLCSVNVTQPSEVNAKCVSRSNPTALCVVSQAIADGSARNVTK
jgi:hypothetical protein